MARDTVFRTIQLEAENRSDGAPYLVAILSDPSASRSGLFDALGAVRLPEPALALADACTAARFLEDFRAGKSFFSEEAKAYGRALHDSLFPADSDLGQRWRRALEAAGGGERALRLEITIPPDERGRYGEQHLSTVPFELLADERGFLFRRHGWRLVRSFAGLATRDAAQPPARPRALVAWANPERFDAGALVQDDFEAHEHAVAKLLEGAGAETLEAVRHADRERLKQALKDAKPLPVLVWVGHGVPEGGGLLLHDGAHPDYPADPGHPQTAGDFASLVRQGKVELVMLWSCHGAGAATPLDSGVAEALLDPGRGNVVAVLAAHSALGATEAARFAGALFEAWTDAAEGDLEHALAAARLELDERALTWARPVLFTRSPPLQSAYRLERRAAPAHPASAGVPVLVEPLPELSPHFLGRDDDVARHTAALHAGKLVVLQGLPGIGKSELALAVAHGWRRDGGTAAFVRAHELQDVTNLRARLGQMCGLERVEDDAVLGAAFQEVEALLVLDNAEDLLHAPEARAAVRALLDSLLAAAPRLRMLVTTRRELGTLERTRARVDTVPPLDRDSARSLFVHECGARLAPAERDGPELARVMALLDRHPRAIVLAASQVGGEVDLAELARRLEDEGPGAITAREFYGFDFPEDADARLRRDRLVSALNLSYRALERESPDAARLFCALGMFPAGLSQQMVEHSTDDVGESLVRSLASHSLVELAGDERRITLPAPVRRYAAWRLGQRPPEERTAFARRVGEAYVAVLEQAYDCLGTELARGALRWFLAEEANCLAAAGALVAPEAAPNVAARLIEHALAFYTHSGRAPAASERLGEMLRALCSEQTPPKSRANASRTLGDMRLDSYQYAGALEAYEAALAVYREISDRLGEATTLLALGDLRMRIGPPDDARDAYEAALFLYREIRNPLGEANALLALADQYMLDDDLDDARQAYDAALTLYRKAPGRLGEANTLKGLGDLHLNFDSLDAARAAYEAALLIFDEIGQRLGKANTLKGLGDLRATTGQGDAAREAYEAALTIYREIHARHGEANALQRCGQLHLLGKRPRPAFEALLQARAIQAEIGDRSGEAGTCGYLARVAAAAGRMEQAVALGARTRAVLSAVPDRFGVMLATGDLADMLQAVDHRASLAAGFLAWREAQAIGDPSADDRGTLFTTGLAGRLPRKDYQALLADLEANAERYLEAALAKVQAEVDAGRLDPFAVPDGDDD